MNTLVLYFILANLGLAAFYLFFRLLLQKDTFFAGKRIALLVGIVLALTYPLLDLSSWIQRSDSLVAYADVLCERLPEIPANTAALANEAHPKNEVVSRNFTVFDYLLLLYLLTTIFLFFRITRQLFRIRNCRIHAESRELHGQRVYVLKGCQSPFSFFGAVFMDPDVYSDKNQLEIIEHEKAHIKQGHSYDVVFSELVCAFFWINPFVWLLKRSLRENLEFLADRDVIKKGVDPKTYQYKLLQLSCHRSDANMANHFNVSQLKKRIVMMNKKRTSWKGLGKYALYLPLFAALLLTAYAWGQQHETEAKAFVEKVTADSKMVEALTMDEKTLLAQNTSKRKVTIQAKKTPAKHTVEQLYNNYKTIYPDYLGAVLACGVVFCYVGSDYEELYNGQLAEVFYSEVNSCTQKSGDIVIPPNMPVLDPTKVRYIGRSAFKGSKDINSIYLPSTIAYLGDSAFYGCSGLTKINLPAAITFIGRNAFEQCTGLSEIHCESSMPMKIGDQFDAVNKKSCKLFIPKGSLRAYKKAASWGGFVTMIEE